ncbi:hypothetical protein BRD04_05750 [Halobacteriales archaeon QS_9_67_17]|nr:MAG: hypothetical protein BRD04_05750 [Halobacteriales archaeon QS_9_67_17]
MGTGVRQIRGVTVDAKLRRVLGLYAVAVLLHAVFDPAVTYVAVRVVEVGVEANPMLRPHFEAGLFRVVVAHLPLFVLLGCIGGSIAYLFETATGRERNRLYAVSQALLDGTVLWGLLLVAWNLRILATAL